MITETQLEAYGFTNVVCLDDDTEAVIFDWISESGKVSISMEEPDKKYTVYIYTDSVDSDGELGMQAVVELEKPPTLTIEEFINFVKFIEDEV